MEVRDATPAHFLIKIESYSLLDKHGIVKYETGEFEAGDFKWKLIIYPNGHKTRSDGEGYVSVYLAISDITSQPAYLEVNATFSICLYNQISDNYWFAKGGTRRFHEMKREWGVPEFISEKDLTDPSNGYLVGDNCVFGAEVFVNKNKPVIERVSLKNVCTKPYKREFKIPNFSSLTGNWISDGFLCRDCKWKVTICLYPNGNGEAIGRSASIFLFYVYSDYPRRRVKASYSAALINQVSDLLHVKKSGSGWFQAGGNCLGWSSFIELSCLSDPNKGFIVNDCCLIEIEVSVQAIAT